ncbi:hypothetical protein [Methylobacterium mesophilicum]|uniref:hypothetical protein n=1 Tax=Methylobacterium mesophilicum TaxID=39956 RepID=UPI002F2FFE75
MSDTPAAFAVGTLLVLQYVFMLKLWVGYPIQGMGLQFHHNVVVMGITLSVFGSLVIVTASLRLWRGGEAAARKIEREAGNQAFAPMRALLDKISARSTLEAHERPSLFWSPKNKKALEARDRPDRRTSVVVGLARLGTLREDPDLFGALLGHEISHLELAGTRAEQTVRRLAMLHLRVLAWLVVVFALVLAFRDRRGLGSTPALGGFSLVLDPQAYLDVSSQLAALFLSAAVIFVYAYFFVVRREHGHDFRGSQLGATAALSERGFELQPTSLRGRIGRAIREFKALHPTAARRRAVVRQRDFLLLSAIIYPAIVSATQPLSLLMLAGWRTFFGVERQIWNAWLTPFTGLLLYLVLRADIARLGMGLLLRPRRYILQIPVYATVAALSTQLPRFVLEFLFGMRQGFPLSEIIRRFWEGFVTGGSRVALLIGITLLLLAYLSALRIAAVGEARADRLSWLDATTGACVIVGAFAISLLSTATSVVAAMILLAPFIILHATVFGSLQGCRACRSRRRIDAILLRTRCPCGEERLPLSRRWVAEDFRDHLDPVPSNGQALRSK